MNDVAPQPDPEPQPDPAPAAADPAPAGDPAPADHWTDRFDDDTKSFLTAKGLDKLESNEAFDRNLHNYRELEKKLGVGADKLLKMPEDGDVEGWNNLMNQLGRPEKAEDYVVPEGVETDPAVFAPIAAIMHEAGVTAEGAQKIISGVSELAASMQESSNTEIKLGLEAEQAELSKEWGSQNEARMAEAKRAAAERGFDEDMLGALVSVGGFSKVMKNFYEMSKDTKEGTTVDTKSAGELTSGEARSQIDALVQEVALDPKRLAVYNKGIGADFEKKQRLLKIAATQ